MKNKLSSVIKCFILVVALFTFTNVKSVKAAEAHASLCRYRAMVDLNKLTSGHADGNVMHIEIRNYPGNVFQVYAYYTMKDKNGKDEVNKWFIEQAENNVPIKNIYWNSLDYDLYKNGTCPKYAYAAATNELCFSEYPGDCISRTGKGGIQLFGDESYLDDNLASMYAGGLNDASSITSTRNCSSDVFDAATFKQDFRNIWMASASVSNLITYDYDYPSFLDNNTEIKEAKEKYKNSYFDLVNKCTIELKEEEKTKLNNGQITKSQYDKNIAEIEQKKEDITKVVNEFVMADNSSEGTDTTDFACGILPPEFVDKIVRYLNIIKYAGVILAIAFGMLDLTKSILSDDADANNKAIKNLTKRLIAAAVIFIIPLILQFVLNVVEIGGVNTDNPFCIKTNTNK